MVLGLIPQSSLGITYSLSTVLYVFNRVLFSDEKEISEMFTRQRSQQDSSRDLKKDSKKGKLLLG